MKLLIDNSIVFALFIEEINSNAVRELFAQNHEFWFLDFTLIEAANAFASAVKRNRISAHQAQLNFTSLSLLASQIVYSNKFLPSALSLALSINHSVYDCLYAVAAHELEAVLVTNDTKFVAKLDASVYSYLVV